MAIEVSRMCTYGDFNTDLEKDNDVSNYILNQSLIG